MKSQSSLDRIIGIFHGSGPYFPHCHCCCPYTRKGKKAHSRAAKKRIRRAWKKQANEQLFD